MPKKPLSAYIYFSQVTREQIKKGNPKLSVAAIMKEVTNRWSEMSEKEKEPYFTEAKEDKRRYEEEIAKMKQKPTKSEEQDNEGDSYRVDEVEPEEVPQKEPKVEFKSEIPERPPIEEKSIKDISPQQEPWGDRKFKFNLPDSKPMGSGMNQISPIPTFRKEMPNYMGNHYNQNDTYSGSTDNNPQNAFMYRPNMFSPTPFGQNKSPGPSPNMPPMYSPMMARSNEVYRDYSNRGNIN